MHHPPKKAILIGLDCPLPELIRAYGADGTMPRVGQLIVRGVFAENCLCPFPTITPPNWTTLVTGATLGTHGITCFHVHRPGDPLNVIHQAFDTADSRAEYLWDAAERVGKKSILFNYPTSWPPTFREGWQIGGAGLCPNERRQGGAWATLLSLCDSQLFSTEELPQAHLIELRPGSDREGAGPSWIHKPPARKYREASLPLRFRKAERAVSPVTWELLVLDSAGEGFDRVLVAEEKDGARPLATLRVGEWSETLVRTFSTADGERRAAFRFKLLELSPDGQRLRLFLTPLGDLDPLCYPEGLTRSLELRAGLPLPAGPEEPYTLGWIDGDTYVEMWNLAHDWYADVVTQLFAQTDWTLLFMHAHCPDWVYHCLMNKVDPVSQPDPAVRAAAEQIERGCHAGIDRMIGQIVDAAGEDTLVLIVSDHGGVPTTSHAFNLPRLLREAGLTVFETDPETGQERIDWSRTKAVAQRSVYVYVNLKGRDPHGIVEPGEEYERVRDEIIHLLYSCIDPATGRHPVTLALRREDARILGLYGDTVGDVVYAIGPEYGHEHGQQLPTATLGHGQMKSLFIMAGPGVKEGYRLERTMNLTDVVPTICHLLELPVPAQCEGAIVYQALTRPNAPLEEKQRLEENYRRLQAVLEQQEALSHSYNVL